MPASWRIHFPIKLAGVDHAEEIFVSVGSQVRPVAHPAVLSHALPQCRKARRLARGAARAREGARSGGPSGADISLAFTGGTELFSASRAAPACLALRFRLIYQNIA